MYASKILPVQRHISGVIFPIGAVFLSRSIRRRIAVLDPPIPGIQDQYILIYRMQAFPFRSRIPTFHRLGIVKIGFPPRNKIAMKISDVTLCICIDCIIRGIGPDVHHLSESVISLLLCADVGLFQCFCRFPHHSRSNSFTVFHMRDRPVVCMMQSKRTGSNTIFGFITKLHFRGFHRTPFFPVLIA